MSDENVKRWADTWQRAGRELAHIRRRELAGMTEAMAAAAALDFLSTPLPENLPPRQNSGLVEQQRRFLKLRNG